MRKICLLSAMLMLLCCFAACGKSENARIEAVDDLVGKRIGVQLGTTGDTEIAGGIEDAEVVRYASVGDAALALAAGEVDAVIADLEPAKTIVAANPALKLLENTDYAPEEYAIAVQKGDKKMLGLIDVVLTEIKAGSTYDHLIKGFIDTPQEERGAYITGDQIGTAGTLIVATSAEFPPFAYTLADGTIVGLDIEIAKLIAKKADMTLEIRNIAFHSLLSELSDGSVDFVIAGMTVDEDRLRLVDFSPSYYTSEQTVIIRAED